MISKLADALVRIVERWDRMVQERSHRSCEKCKVGTVTHWAHSPLEFTGRQANIKVTFMCDYCTYQEGFWLFEDVAS